MIVSLLRKIAKIILKVILGIFAFYLFLAFIVIPIGAPWAIKSQASRILSHPVLVRTVWFNPFLGRISVNGLKILDADKKVMVGFDKFWLDFSFLSLFKKEYLVESTGLSGLTVNVALLPEGQINLLNLVPKELRQSAKPVANVKPQPIPKIMVDSLVLTQGKVSFVDSSSSANFSAVLNEINVNVTNLSTDPAQQAKVVFQAKLGEKGTISVEALLKPFMQPLEMESVFSLNHYALQAVTPYAGKYTGREVKDGILDLKMDYRITGNKINAQHKLLVQHFNFGKKVESKDALPLPFGLAVALLEDPQGRISIALPVTGDLSQPEFKYFHLLGQVAKNFFLKLVTSPILSLVSMVGEGPGTEELGSLSFEPGKDVLPEAATEQLKVLVKVLKERPKLSLEVNGSYDPDVDWKAIKTEAFDNQYASFKKESSMSDFKIVEYLYKTNFSMRSYWKFAREDRSKYKTEDEFKAEMKRQIIEKGLPDRAALDSLAQSRAKAVYDFIIASGFESTRVKIGQNRKTQSSLGKVPLEFTMMAIGESE